MALLLLAQAACAPTRGGGVPYGRTDFVAPDAPSQTALDADYRIAPLDKLAIKVFQVQELTGEYKVDLTGNVAMPLLGNVPAVDKTPIQLQEKLTQLLSAKYLKNPDVTVGVIEAGGSKITIDGAVREPGIFPVFGKATLIQMIALAKGLDETANPKRVVIFRQIDGKRMAAAFDMTTIRGGKEDDPPVYRGDIIVVDGSKSRQGFRDIISAMPILSVFSPLTY